MHRNDGGELFGTATAGANGGKAADGFAALGELDSNGDGLVDQRDARFGELRVWVDGNADGVSQAAELKTLAELHIAQLTVAASKVNERDNDNWIGLRGGFVSSDGLQGQMADVWFLAERAAQQSAPLSAKVSGLTQAIADFGHQPGAATGGLAWTADPAGTAATAAASAGAAAGLAGSVAALGRQLQQFQADHAGRPAESAAGPGEEWRRRLEQAGILAAK